MLVNCVAYQDGKKLADISVEEIGRYVRRPECFVWVALKDPEPAELAAMQQEFGLHELAVEDAQHGHQRPKFEEYGDSLFFVLHTVELERGALSLGEVDVFVGRNYVLSVRSRARQGFADVRARCEREPDLLQHGSGFVLYALMDAVVDRYFPVVEEIECELERVEQQIFAGAPARANVEALYGLKQKLTRPAARDASAARGHGQALRRARAIRLRADAGVLPRRLRPPARINQSIDSLRETVNTATSVNLSLISLQENETTKRLAAYAALVAVPTLIAGLYGMNFEQMPELRWELGYPVTVGVMVAIDVYLFFRFRRAGWL